MIQFELDKEARRHPEGRRFRQRAEGYACHIPLPGDPSLRLKDGSGQDDAFGMRDVRV